MALTNASLGQVLEIYGAMTERTLLLHPHLVLPMKISSSAARTTQREGAEALEKLLATNGIVSVPDGEKFLMIVPKAEALKARPGSSQITRGKNSTGKQEVIPAGMIDFRGATAAQVLSIYTALKSRKPELAGPSPPIPINLRAETTLTREEALYAMETLFAWQGFKVVPIGEEFLKFAPLSGSER